jgi:hypothetical protein
MFVEAKYLRRQSPVGLHSVRNAWATILDVNENQSRTLGRPLRRYRYVYALFSRSGFSLPVQQFAAAHQISLVDLSASAFRSLRRAVRVAAASLSPVMTGTGRLSLMREYLRKELGIWDWSLDTWQNITPDPAISTAITSVGRRLQQNLAAYDGGEILLGFPPAPFIIALAGAEAGSLAAFHTYTQQHPEHEVLIRRASTTPTDRADNWLLSPAADPSFYSLTFSLPTHIEEWITGSERDRSRARWVKQELLSAIVIYRVVDGIPKVYRLMYAPARLRER